MGEDQPVKFIERMFSQAARDRVAILAVPRSVGRGEQRVYTLPLVSLAGALHNDK